jgi:bacillithiol biosynthesis cysteine-adding enzyme BshC
MQAQQFPDLEFRKLNELVHAYCSKNPQVRDFFEVNPDLTEMASVALRRNMTFTHYEVLTSVLREQYQRNSAIEAVDENLAAFSAGNAITVTTGHQLCLLGGPAYFFFKILSTIKLAQNLQALVSDKKIVPIFWLASEDHDKEEINHTYVNGNRLEWNTSQNGAVGRFALDGFEDVLLQWVDSVEDDNLRNSFRAIWNRAAQFGTWAELTKSWVHECFGEWGLVVINPDDTRLKQLFAPVMKRELLQGVAFQCLSKSNERLTQLGYHVQVTPREINLFYLSHQSRVRIESGEHSWHTTDKLHNWNQTQVLAELEKHPENFSPNVLFRPLYQETILPNVAYVGGPGELAYWLQLKGLFTEYDISMPALVLRDSALLISPTTSKRLAKLGLNHRDLLRDKHELVETLVGQKPDFTRDKDELFRVFEQLADRIAQVDSTLRASAMAEANRALVGIDQLQAKMWKAVKLKEEQKLSSLDKVWGELYPSNNWQERSLNILKEAMANDKELMRLLLLEFQPPMSTLVIVES